MLRHAQLVMAFHEARMLCLLPCRRAPCSCASTAALAKHKAAGFSRSSIRPFKLHHTCYALRYPPGPSVELALHALTVRLTAGVLLRGPERSEGLVSRNAELDGVH